MGSGVLLIVLSREGGFRRTLLSELCSGSPGSCRNSSCLRSLLGENQLYDTHGPRSGWGMCGSEGGVMLLSVPCSRRKNAGKR